MVFASGYGEASPGVDVTTDTPFLLGSTTKAFTALAVMRLVQQGQVELDSPVKKYLPEFRFAGTYSSPPSTLGLNKDTPNLRAVSRRPSSIANVVALPRVGGFHHRYEWRDAA